MIVPGSRSSASCLSEGKRSACLRVELFRRLHHDSPGKHFPSWRVCRWAAGRIEPRCVQTIREGLTDGIRIPIRVDLSGRRTRRTRK
jgi:hypothetical protein